LSAVVWGLGGGYKLAHEGFQLKTQELETIALGHPQLEAAYRKFRSGEFEIAQVSLILLLNFGLGRRLKFSQEHNFLCYISNLEHRLFSISPYCPYFL